MNFLATQPFQSSYQVLSGCIVKLKVFTKGQVLQNHMRESITSSLLTTIDHSHRLSPNLIIFSILTIPPNLVFPSQATLPPLYLLTLPLIPSLQSNIHSIHPLLCLHLLIYSQLSHVLHSMPNTPYPISIY